MSEQRDRGQGDDGAARGGGRPQGSSEGSNAGSSEDSRDGSRDVRSADAAPVAYGTAAHDAPVTRADFERALRALHLADFEMRDSFMRLAAQVVALTDELVRRVDRVEPAPAPAGTAPRATRGTIEDAVGDELPRATLMVQVGDERSTGRTTLFLGSEDKYAAPPLDIPCAELVHLCHAKCCAMSFALSTQDLDEGVIRWDYGTPYLIRQRASDGFCVHNHPTTRGCTVHAQRPRVCRLYDCRDDARVWKDYARRIPADEVPASIEMPVDLLARARARYDVFDAEAKAVRGAPGDDGPVVGPVVAPRPPR